MGLLRSSANPDTETVFIMKLINLTVAAGSAILLSHAALGEVVYQLSPGASNFSYTSASEYGDEIVLDRAGWILTGFTFEYSANYSQAGGLTLKLYSQDGPAIGGAASPGSLLGSFTFDIQNGGGTPTVSFPENPANALPDRLTWTATFSGVGGANVAGLLAPDASPVVGLSANDFWVKTGPGDNDWALSNFGAGGPQANFVATVNAVPEPGTVALMVAGLGSLLWFSRRK